MTPLYKPINLWTSFRFILMLLHVKCPTFEILTVNSGNIVEYLKVTLTNEEVITATSKVILGTTNLVDKIIFCGQAHPRGGWGDF